MSDRGCRLHLHLCGRVWGTFIGDMMWAVSLSIDTTLILNGRNCRRRITTIPLEDTPVARKAQNATSGSKLLECAPCSYEESFALWISADEHESQDNQK
jgi:hypothetical protein